jgi:hypothetical protein
MKADLGGNPAALWAARLYDEVVELASERGVDVCPECFSPDVWPGRVREKAGVKVQRCQYERCLARFAKGWLSIGTVAPPEQVEIALTFISGGMPIRAVLETFRSLSKLRFRSLPEIQNER